VSGVQGNANHQLVVVAVDACILSERRWVRLTKRCDESVYILDAAYLPEPI